MINPHGVMGFSEYEVGGNSWNWLGATVELEIFEKIRRGEVEETDDWDDLVGVRIEEGDLSLLVTIPISRIKEVDPNASGS